MERFHEKDENFAAMKVFATHQAAHIEFGSFDFDFHRPGAVFPLRRVAFAGDRAKPATTDMEEFFDLFSERQLASDLFTIAEDSRIDANIKREYGGIRKPLLRMQHELLKRPTSRNSPYHGFLENLVRPALCVDAIRCPKDLPSDARVLAS